jgi:carboxybiotin decarboxylase
MLGLETLDLLLQGLTHVSVQSVVMIGVAFVLLYLGIVKDYEPLLLVPIAAGCLLANLPLSPLVAEDGMLRVLYDMGIRNELFPLLIFIGIGALTDFGPLLENPRLVLLGAAGQFGIFMTLLARSTGRPRSTSAACWRRTCWGRSPWRRTATCRWCRSSCRRSCGC